MHLPFSFFTSYILFYFICLQRISREEFNRITWGDLEAAVGAYYMTMFKDTDGDGNDSTPFIPFLFHHMEETIK